MAQEIKLELPSGGTVFAVASGKGGFEEYATPGPVTRKLTEIADELRETLSVLAGRLESLTPRQPDEITLEMNVEVGSGGALKILTADIKGGMKVTLKWDNAKPTEKAPPSA